MTRESRSKCLEETSEEQNPGYLKSSVKHAQLSQGFRVFCPLQVLINSGDSKKPVSVQILSSSKTWLDPYIRGTKTRFDVQVIPVPSA